MLRVILGLIAGMAMTLHAQTPVFIEQVGLLDDSDLPDGPFTSGIAVGVVDMDGDGRDDIVRIHDREELRIEYQEAAGEIFGHRSMGTLRREWAWSLCAADADRDGFNDIVVGLYRWGHDLFASGGDPSGYDRTTLPSQVKVVQGTVFADIDNDGEVDIFACDDDGDLHKYANSGGIFSLDDTLIPTLLDSQQSNANAGNYAIIESDVDGDGDRDFYLSKCLGESLVGGDSPESLGRINRLFLNEGDDGYKEVPGAAGLASGAQTWCADFGDVDNDGDLDCFLLNHQGANSTASALYENNGSGVFTEVTEAAGLSGEVDFWGMQVLFRDFNNDGWVDLMASSMAATPAEETYGYYQNDGDGTFTRVSGVLKQANAVDEVERIYSFAVGDLNHDGFLDLYAGRGKFINAITDEPDLLLFNQGNDNGFLSMTLAGAASNANGIGAWVEIHGPWGVQVRELRGGEGYGIMNSLNLHFGLGEATEVERLVVRWPSGLVEEIEDLPGNRFVTLHEGEGRAAYSFRDWINDYFPSGDEGTEGDPDKDGVANLIEQILGTEPNQPSGMDGLTIDLIEDEGLSYVLLKLERVPVQGVEMSWEFSTDGFSWAADEAMEVIEDAPSSYVVRLPTEPDGKVLARLRATEL